MGSLAGWSPSPTSWDALVGVCWLAANLACVTSAWVWARRLFPLDSFHERVGHTVVLLWGGIVAIATFLGCLGMLTGPAVLAGAVTASAGAIGVARVLPAGGSPRARDLADNRFWLSLWVLLACFWLAHVITMGLGEFPDDVDSLAYHLPLVDQWLQDRSLWSTRSNRWSSPGNNELLALWAVAPFSGDFLVALNNLPAAVLLGSAAVAFGSRIGLLDGWAHLAGLATVCHFVVLKQLVDQMNDVAVAACFFASLSYVLRDHAKPSFPARVLAAVSLGLLAGIKYYALGYAGLVFVTWVALAFVSHGPRQASRALGAGVAGILLFGGFWYARNWLLTGTPLYPAGSMHAALYPDVSQTSFLGNRRPELLRLYVIAIWQRTGPCQTLGFLLVPVSLAWLLGSAVRAVRRGTEPNRAAVRLGVVVLVAGTGLLLGVTPMAIEDDPGTLNQLRGQYCPVRYGLCFLSVATVAMLAVLQDVLCPFGLREGQPGRDAPAERRGWRAGMHFWIGTLLGGAILFQVFWADRWLRIHWTDAGLILVGLVSFACSFALLRRRPAKAPLALATIAFASAWGWACAFLSDGWHREFDWHYAGDRRFLGLRTYAAAGCDPKSTLMLQPLCYPYLGSRREHRIYQPVRMPSAEWVMQFIEAEGIGVVHLGARPTATSRKRWFPAMDECLARYPSKFRKVGQGSWGVLFEVRPGQNDAVGKDTLEGREAHALGQGPGAGR